MVQGRNQVTTRPSRRGAIWVGGVTLFAVGVIATVYWSTVGSRAAQPSLRSVTCHWQGHRVVVSGVAFNPNSTAQEVVISNIRVRFDRGPMMKLVNSFGPRRLEGFRRTRRPPGQRAHAPKDPAGTRAIGSGRVWPTPTTGSEATSPGSPTKTPTPCRSGRVRRTEKPRV